MKASAEEAKRLMEQAEALRLLEEGRRAYKSMEWKRAHDALMPAAALAPDNEEIRDALALATTQYEAWLEASERQRRAREEEEARRQLAAELARQQHHNHLLSQQFEAERGRAQDLTGKLDSCSRTCEEPKAQLGWSNGVLCGQGDAVERLRS